MKYKREKNILLVLLIGTLIVFTSCSDDEVPGAENEEEIITDVTLTFSPVAGGLPIVATAQDPDGEGPNNIEIVDQIQLAANTKYILTIEAENSIAGESIAEEIKEEAEEHMFFFGWSNGLFMDPSGDGNIDNREDPLNYVDFDGNELPLGLKTEWTSGAAGTGTLRVILKHQPDIKSATSTASDGESDVDLEWDIIIE